MKVAERTPAFRSTQFEYQRSAEISVNGKNFRLGSNPGTPLG